jgi:putative hemin transport protein
MALRRGADERLLDIARAIGVTEAELVASAWGATADVQARRLREDWPLLLGTLPALGSVNAISQNDGAVLEVAGRYEHANRPRSSSPGRIDVRFSIERLKFGFLLSEGSSRGERQSVQLFDDRGSSIHQVVLAQPATARALDPLVDDGRPAPLALSKRKSRVVRHGGPFDVEALRAGWREIESPRDFTRLLAKFQVTELQAMHLAGSELAFRVPAQTLEKVLGLCVELGVPISAIVRNRGIRQTYEGSLNRLARIGRWLTFSGATFRLRVRDDLAESAWIVRRPYRMGPSTTLELYGPSGEQLVSIGAAKERGLRAAWAILISTFSEGTQD